MKLRISILLFLICFVCFSCRRNEMENELKAFIGKQIVLPDSLCIITRNKDTIGTEFLNARVKMVIFYDSTECTSCRINKLFEWREVIQVSRRYKNLFNVVFIFSPKKGADYPMGQTLKSSRFDYPVFLDKSTQFCQLNPLVSNKKIFHVFLLDNQNRVVLAGDPLDNVLLWDLYKQEIERLIH